MRSYLLGAGLVALAAAASINLEIGDIAPASFERNLEVDLITNSSALIDPNLLIPKMAADRATTQCGCGYSITNPAAGRIVGGAVVNPANSLPYQVYTQPCFESGQCYLCGATLLNKRYVLTAAHCVRSNGVLANKVMVGLGMHGLYDTAPGVQRIPAEKIIARDDYNEETSDNDFALLRLSKDVVFSSTVVPACLPTNPALTYAGKTAIVSGWGTTSSGGNISQTLKSTNVTITAQNDATCTKYAGRTGGATLPNSQMCAYTPSTDSCQGDSGGPLVVMEDGRYTVVGVVSYGRGCASPGYAGVYARVTNFLDWVNANIADGWCSATNPTTPAPSTTTTTRAPVTSAATTTRAPTTTMAPTTTTTTTTTTKPSNITYYCDLSCLDNVGQQSGYVSVAGVDMICDYGFCHSTSVDLCNYFVNCALTTTTTPSTITYYCDLSCLNAVGQQSGYVSVAGVDMICDYGFCHSTSVNLCDYFVNCAL